MLASGARPLAADAGARVGTSEGGVWVRSRQLERTLEGRGEPRRLGLRACAPHEELHKQCGQDDDGGYPDQAQHLARMLKYSAVGTPAAVRAYLDEFASHADAVGFCSALKAAGKPCFVK